MNENQHLQIWILNLRLNPRSIHRDVDTVWSAGVKRELSAKGKVMIYHSFSLSILIYDHKLLYGVHFRTSLMIQAAEISIKRNEHLMRVPPGCHVGKRFWACPTGGGLGQDPGLTGEIISLGWLGNNSLPQRNEHYWKWMNTNSWIEVKFKVSLILIWIFFGAPIWTFSGPST